MRELRSEFGTGGAEGGSPMKITRMPAALAASKGEGQFRQRAFRWLLEREVDVSGKRVVDLGAGPCNFARVRRTIRCAGDRGGRPRRSRSPKPSSETRSIKTGVAGRSRRHGISAVSFAVALAGNHPGRRKERIRRNRASASSGRMFGNSTWSPSMS